MPNSWQVRAKIWEICGQISWYVCVYLKSNISSPPKWNRAVALRDRIATQNLPQFKSCRCDELFSGLRQVAAVPPPKKVSFPNL